MSNGVKRYASEEYVNNAIGELVFPEQKQPDWNQNDEAAVDYIKNRPFYDDVEKTLIEYNDSTPINISTKIGTVYFISSLVPTMEELIGATVIYGSSNLTTQVLTANDITTSSAYPGAYCVNGISYGGSDNGFFVVYDYTQSIKFTQNGIYVVNTIQSIEISSSMIKTIDEKYIPDTIARTEDVVTYSLSKTDTTITLSGTDGSLSSIEENTTIVTDDNNGNVVLESVDSITDVDEAIKQEIINATIASLNTETLTFTLDDGTTVTKEVVVKCSWHCTGINFSTSCSSSFPQIR